MSGVNDRIWFLREGLFAKYVVSLVGLVLFVLVVNGAIEQRRADYAQLLNQVAAVNQLSQLNGHGHEQLRLSRTAIAVSSGGAT